MSATTLSDYLADFLAMKRSTAAADGRDRKRLRYTEKLLRSFLTFWHERERPWPIRAALALEWVAIGAQPQHPHRDQHRLQAVRAFLRQVRTFEPDTDVPENIFGSQCRRRTPHLFSDDEIGRLLAAPYQLRLFDAFRPLTLYSLMGLLASTGLRIGEALRLIVEDAKLDTSPPHLLIYETKFGKSRVVVLHPSTADHLRQYGIARGRALDGHDAEPFFTNRLGKPLDYTTTHATFRRLLRRAGIQSRPGHRAPSLHSFRHTFAVNRLTRWHRERRDVQELLPHLAVYLGHSGPENTYWYLTATPELLQTAAGLFDSHFSEGVASQ